MYPIDPIYQSNDQLLPLIKLSYWSDLSIQGSIALTDLTILSIRSVVPTIRCSRWFNRPIDPIYRSIVPTDLTILSIRFMDPLFLLI